jgi:hypothetical protein
MAEDHKGSGNNVNTGGGSIAIAQQPSASSSLSSSLPSTVCDELVKYTEDSKTDKNSLHFFQNWENSGYVLDTERDLITDFSGIHRAF